MQKRPKYKIEQPYNVFNGFLGPGASGWRLLKAILGDFGFKLAMLADVGVKLGVSWPILVDLGVKLGPSWQDLGTKMPKMSQDSQLTSKNLMSDGALCHLPVHFCARRGPRRSLQVI